MMRWVHCITILLITLALPSCYDDSKKNDQRLEQLLGLLEEGYSSTVSGYRVTRVDEYEYDPAQTFVGYSTYTYAHDNDLYDAVELYDTNGSRTATAVCTNNGQKIVREEWFDPDLNPLWTTTYTYNAGGNMTRRSMVYPRGQESYTDFSYSAGRISIDISYMKIGATTTLISRGSYLYTGNMLTRITYRDAFNNVISYTDFTYDANGNIDVKSTKNAAETLLSTCDHTWESY